ncbi:helix-turn-helix domain-containing protein [Actinokineospora sp. 24-640]
MSRDLADALAADQRAIVARVLARTARAMPSLGEEVLRVAAPIVRAALRPLNTPLDPLVRPACAEIARHFVRAGLPSDDLLRTCKRAAGVLMAEIWSRAGEGGCAQALALAARVAEDTEVIADFLAEGYLGGVWLDAGAARRQAAVRGLLLGRLPPGTAEAPCGYLVAHLRITHPALYAREATRMNHQARRRDILVQVLDHEQAMVLIRPLNRTGTTARAEAERALSALVERGAALGFCAPVGGCAYADSAKAVPDAVRSAASLALITRSSAVHLVGAVDLLLENAMSAAPDAAVRLHERLAPVLAEPSLVTTLRVFFDSDLDRTSAAARLHIHRATLASRLRRVRELTGVVPTSVLGIKLFTVALALAETVR